MKKLKHGPARSRRVRPIWLGIITVIGLGTWGLVEATSGSGGHVTVKSVATTTTVAISTGTTTAGTTTLLPAPTDTPGAPASTTIINVGSAGGSPVVAVGGVRQHRGTAATTSTSTTTVIDVSGEGATSTTLATDMPDVHNPNVWYHYTVKQSDSFWSISQQLVAEGAGQYVGTFWTWFVAANPQLTNPGFLLVGEVVNLPKGTLYPNPIAIPSTTAVDNP